MKLLVVGAAAGTKRMLRKLVTRGALELEWRAVDDDLSRRMEGCAAVLIDGAAARSERGDGLLERVGRLRRRMRGVPVLVLSTLGAERSSLARALPRRDQMPGTLRRPDSPAPRERRTPAPDPPQRELLDPATLEFRG